MAVFRLAWKSLLNRRSTAILTVISIALSVWLLVGVERLRNEARASFANTISGTDLIVGARAGSVQLLLYSVFHIGNATNNISWESYQDVVRHRRVAWSVPIALGDSHRGYRVVGTTTGYFEHYRYSRNVALRFAQGQPFDDLFDAVIGAEVAEKLGYAVGEEIIVAHGGADVSFARHDDKPFRVSGVLRRTGTPVDKSVFVSLEAIEAIHLGWQGGAPLPGVHYSAEKARSMKLAPKTITAALVGLKSKVSTFRVQRTVNDYRQEPLTAILPGVALAELWSMIGVAENALLIVSAFVVVVGLFGMLTALLTSLNERRREMAILRSVGARPGHIFSLIVGEAAFLTLMGIVFGIAALYLGLYFGQTVFEAQFGLRILISGLTDYEWMLLGGIWAAGVFVGLIPAYKSYRMALADGLSVRV